MNDETIVSRLDDLKKEEEKRPYLSFIKGPKLGQLIPLEKNEMTVGRSSECDICIEDTTISRKHFKLKITGKKVLVEDLGSTNGTHINGKKIQVVCADDGDKIQISRETIFKLSFLDETQSTSEKMRYEMGVMDAVTNTYNKRYFLERIREEFSFSSRKNRSLSVIMFDLDHFKKLNDTYGHLAGDLVLQGVAKLISQTIRTDDVFARFGGEEFVILMRDATVQNAFDLAERIRKKIENWDLVYSKQTIKVTLSAGVAEIHHGMTDYPALLKEADACLYQAKEKGRNQVQAPEKSSKSLQPQEEVPRVQWH